ncbi:MAG: hypothetical protein LBT22_03680, partial [Peptococcaceae bacterium]|nr:hypothetical protein [Peptococcaceae bacterium]
GAYSFTTKEVVLETGDTFVLPTSGAGYTVAWEITGGTAQTDASIGEDGKTVTIADDAADDGTVEFSFTVTYTAGTQTPITGTVTVTITNGVSE